MKTLSTERTRVSPARPPASDAAVTPPVPLTLTRPGHQPRPKPPRHLADLDLAARRAAVAALGAPPPVPPPRPRPAPQPRPKPPRHLADLALAARRAAVADLGEPPFRAVQLS